MESLIASAILFAGVLAVISAIMSGQEKAFEAEQQVVATLAAEEVMGQIVMDDYDQLETHWMGLQPAGEFVALITISIVREDLSDLGVVVQGKTANIKIYPSISDPWVLAELSHFLPEPQS